MAHFGFTPSNELLLNTQKFISKKTDIERGILRDHIALQINQEMIDCLLTKVVADFPENDRKETVEKLAHFIQSSVAVLLKQLLGKATPSSIQKGILFSKNSLFKPLNHDHKIGQVLEKDIVINLQQHFSDLKSGKKVNLEVLSADYKLFADELIRHFMYNFYQTLELGMIKRKASEMGCITTTKAVHVAIDKLIPRLSKDELKVLAQHHDMLFFNH